MNFGRRRKRLGAGNIKKIQGAEEERAQDRKT